MLSRFRTSTRVSFHAAAIKGWLAQLTASFPTTVYNLRSDDYNLLIKSQLIGAPIGYMIGEQPLRPDP
jgi:hypothetical protein